MNCGSLAKRNTLVCPSAPQTLYARRIRVSFSLYVLESPKTLTRAPPYSGKLLLTCISVAKIDAVQAEYSAFETGHETDGLIDTAKELGVAYVAFSPLGHGWLVDDFPFSSPDDFAPDDFRRTGTCHVSPHCCFLISSFECCLANMRTRQPRLTIAVPKFQGENFYKNKAIVEKIKALAQRKNCKTTQVALAWVASQGMIAIPGTTKPGRLDENWGSRAVKLSEEEKKEMRKIIDDAKPVGNRYSAAHQSMVGH